MLKEGTGFGFGGADTFSPAVLRTAGFARDMLDTIRSKMGRVFHVKHKDRQAGFDTWVLADKAGWEITLTLDFRSAIEGGETLRVKTLGRKPNGKSVKGATISVDADTADDSDNYAGAFAPLSTKMVIEQAMMPNKTPNADRMIEAFLLESQLYSLMEGGLSRVLKHAQSGKPFAVLTAYRGENTPAENERRNGELASILNSAKMGAHKLLGHWAEAPEGWDYQNIDGQPHIVNKQTGQRISRDKAMQAGALKDQAENSFFIPKPDSMSDEGFQKFVQGALQKYNQDSAVYSDGKSINLMDKTGGGFKVGDGMHVSHLGQAFSQMRGKKVPFVFTSKDESGQPEGAVAQPSMDDKGKPSGGGAGQLGQSGKERATLIRQAWAHVPAEHKRDQNGSKQIMRQHKGGGSSWVPISSLSTDELKKLASKKMDAKPKPIQAPAPAGANNTQVA